MSERIGLLASVAGAAAALLSACASSSRAGMEEPLSGTEPSAEPSAEPQLLAEPQPLAPSRVGSEPAELPSAFSHEGQCSFEGSGVFRDGAYAGSVAFVLFAEPFGDEELCRMSFDLDTVANADPECDFCFFSTVVQLSNPVQVVNVDALCENSERALRPAAIQSMLAAPVAMGFAEEATGHGQVLVEYDEERMRWAEVTFGSFEPATGVLTYNKNEGFCRY